MLKKLRRSLLALAAALLTTATVGLVAAAPAHADSRCQLEWYSLQNGSGNLALDVWHQGGSTATVDGYTPNWTAAQAWCLEPAAEGGYYFHPSYNLGLCLDVPYGRYNVGQGMWIYNCNGTQPQRFSINTPCGSGFAVEPYTSRLSLAASGGVGSQVVLTDATYCWYVR
jgi:hypothetical protein